MESWHSLSAFQHLCSGASLRSHSPDMAKQWPTAQVVMCMLEKYLPVLDQNWQFLEPQLELWCSADSFLLGSKTLLKSLFLALLFCFACVESPLLCPRNQLKGTGRVPLQGILNLEHVLRQAPALPSVGSQVLLSVQGMEHSVRPGDFQKVLRTDLVLMCDRTICLTTVDDQDGPPCFAGALPVTVSGGIGGAAFWLAVYPIDSVKSRIQVLSMAGRQDGFLLSFLHILRTEGKCCIQDWPPQMPA